MQELQISQVFAAVDDALKNKQLGRVEALLVPAVEQYPEVPQFWFYMGCLFYKTGRYAIAREMFERAVELEPSAIVYSNLGACLRRMNLHQEGKNALQLALDLDPTNLEALVNMGAMSVNEGDPATGIPYLEQARALGQARGSMEAGTVWNLGLLYLESGRFGEGFDCYRQAGVEQREARMYAAEGAEEPKVFQAGDETAGKTIIVYGEQGIGDELMYGTMLEEARKDFARVIFECHPRLESLHRRAHPGLEIHPERKEPKPTWQHAEPIVADYKCPIGDLGALYRRQSADFLRRPAGIYREFNADVRDYRAALVALAEGRPIVGLATRGGVMQTSRTYRTVRQVEIDRLMTETSAMFVSFDYEDVMDLARYVTDKYGESRFKWWPSIVQHWDYHHAANLLAATDMLVTVCQSIAHLSAGMGHPTRVITPIRCAWRYARAPGIPDETWYWYPHTQVKLYRQDEAESWRHPLDRVIADINHLETAHAKAQAPQETRPSPLLRAVP